MLGGKPGFVTGADAVHVLTPEGLVAVAPDGKGQRRVAQVQGPGWYFAEGPAPVDDLRLSPDGRWLLAQIAQQLWLVGVPETATAVVDLSAPEVAFRKLTDVGADFFDWSADGETVSWSVGSTWYRRPLDNIRLQAANETPAAADAPAPGARGVEAFATVVELPRDRPAGVLLLRGATALTMQQGDTVIEDADILIVDDRIAAIGTRGGLDVPADAAVRDVGGLYAVPGFIESHDHIADIRRDVLDLEAWSLPASLAFGVTTRFDPSSLSIDMFAYADLVDAGLITGSRIHTTGPALFSFNRFRSPDEVRKVLTRYRDHYRTRNIKMYRTGNRTVRQWVAMAAADMGMLPTTEGALSLKLNLSQVMDGFAGIEHALPAVPLYRDVVRLLADSDVSYTTTLMITNGGPEGQDYFIARDDPVEDPVLNRFWPRFALDIKMRQRTWRTPDDYLFQRVAASAARISRAGGLVGMGSHGEAPAISFHWEMQAHAMGGMAPMEVLRAATIGSARAIGRQDEFGSLEPGKYADLMLLERNPLDTIENTLSLAWVMKNGRLYDARTLDEVWPRQRERQPGWFVDDVPRPREGFSLTEHRNEQQ
jgi:hypothetical protein